MKESSGRSIGILGLVFIVFLVLKLAEIGQVATWSWWAVTAPLWAPSGIVIVLLILYFIGQILKRR